MIGLALLLASCAPAVHPTTMQAIVQHESHSSQFAIGVNGGYTLPHQPANRAEAVAAARSLISAGVSADFGLAQINGANFQWLGLTPESVFDPCTNLKAAQTVLLQGYRRAAATYGEGQQALQVALSYYNTGKPDRGFSNGYVSKVIAQVPALEPGVIVTSVPDGKGQTIAEPQGREAFGSEDRHAFGDDGRAAFGAATTK